MFKRIGLVHRARFCLAGKEDAGVDDAHHGIEAAGLVEVICMLHVAGTEAPFQVQRGIRPCKSTSSVSACTASHVISQKYQIIASSSC